MSRHPHSALKPACHSLKNFVHSFTILCSKMTLIILYTCFNKPIALYLEQSLCESFFLKIITKMQTTRFGGTSSFCHTFCRNSNSAFLVTVEFFHTSAGISSIPAALEFFILDTAYSNSSHVIRASSLLFGRASNSLRSRSTSVGENFFAKNSCQTSASSSGLSIRVLPCGGVFSFLPFAFPACSPPVWLAAISSSPFRHRGRRSRTSGAEGLST